MARMRNRNPNKRPRIPGSTTGMGRGETEGLYNLYGEDAYGMPSGPIGDYTFGGNDSTIGTTGPTISPTFPEDPPTFSGSSYFDNLNLDFNLNEMGNNSLFNNMFKGESPFGPTIEKEILANPNLLVNPKQIVEQEPNIGPEPTGGYENLPFEGAFSYGGTGEEGQIISDIYGLSDDEFASYMLDESPYDTPGEGMNVGGYTFTPYSMASNPIKDRVNEINWDNPTNDDYALIMSQPKLQQRLLLEGMKHEGKLDFLGASGNLREDFIDDFFKGSFTGFGDVDEGLYTEYGTKEVDKRSDLDKVLSYLGYGGGGTFTVDTEDVDEEKRDALKQLFTNLETGMDRLGGMKSLQEGLDELKTGAERKEASISDYETQKQVLSRELSKDIGRGKKAYVPQERMSRYAGLTGSRAVKDPTQAYGENIYKTIGDYMTQKSTADIGIRGLEDVISDLTGTGARGVREQYGADVSAELEDILKDLYS